MRVAALAIVVLLAACTAEPRVTEPTPAPTREANTVNVSVLLDLSGSRAPSGTPQRNAMQLWLDQAQASAGPVKLKAKFVDVASSDAQLLLAMRRAAVEDHADAIVIGAPVVLDDSFTLAAQVAQIPILLTLPAPEPAASVGGRWVFVLAPTPATLARTAVADAVARGVIAPMLLASDDTAAAVVERAAVLAELARGGLVQPTPVIVTQSDGMQRARTAAAVARSVVMTGATAPYVDLIRSLPAGLAAPRVYLSYLTESTDLASLRDQISLVTWPGSRYLASLSVTPMGARATFIQSYTGRFGAPSTLAATGYDALSLIEAAAAEAPAELEATRLRLRLETLTFAGIVTRYSFSFTRHAGFATDDLAFLRWNAQRAAPFLAPDPTGNAK